MKVSATKPRAKSRLAARRTDSAGRTAAALYAVGIGFIGFSLTAIVRALILQELIGVQLLPMGGVVGAWLAASVCCLN